MNQSEINRRHFLRAGIAAGAVIVADGPRGAFAHGRERAVAGRLAHGYPIGSSLAEEAPKFAPVKVARNRIIRTVVGLRPFRDEGFVVDASVWATNCWSITTVTAARG